MAPSIASTKPIPAKTPATVKPIRARSPTAATWRTVSTTTTQLSWPGGGGRFCGCPGSSVYCIS